MTHIIWNDPKKELPEAGKRAIIKVQVQHTKRVTLAQYDGENFLEIGQGGVSTHAINNIAGWLYDSDEKN